MAYEEDCKECGRSPVGCDCKFTPTLRDQFAALALSGFLANGCSSPMATAEKAYAMADAMLAARKQ